MPQGGSSIIKTIGGAIHDTLNGVGDLDEKVVGSLEEAASKVIKSTEHAVKDSHGHRQHLSWDLSFSFDIINKFKPYTKRARQHYANANVNTMPISHYVMFLSHNKSGVVIPITISSQSDRMSCSVLVDTGFQSPSSLKGYNVNSVFQPCHSNHIIISLGPPVIP